MRKPNNLPDVCSSDILKLYQEYTTIATMSTLNGQPHMSLEMARIAARDQ